MQANMGSHDLINCDQGTGSILILKENSILPAHKSNDPCVAKLTTQRVEAKRLSIGPLHWWMCWCIWARSQLFSFIWQKWIWGARFAHGGGGILIIFQRAFRCRTQLRSRMWLETLSIALSFLFVLIFLLLLRSILRDSRNNLRLTLSDSKNRLRLGSTLSGSRNYLSDRVRGAFVFLLKAALAPHQNRA